MLQSAASTQSQEYRGQLSAEQVAMLEAEFAKAKTLHSTDLSLLAAEMAANEKEVQVIVALSPFIVTFI